MTHHLEDIMDQLLTRKMNHVGAVISIVLLVIAFWGLVSGWPLGYAYLMIAGIVGTILTFGLEGLKELYAVPKNRPILTVILAFFATIVIGYTIAIIAAFVFGHSFTSNPGAQHISETFLILVPSLIGEELMVMVPLLIGANWLGGSKKAVVIMIIITTVIFGAAHLQTYNFDYLQVAIIGLIRVPFTIASLRNKSIITGTATHIIYDFMSFSLILL
ncbi:hypothetical protein SAMN05444162_1652 [Paenibacillaceae bacterium GAS479]|nr:hypothetical protein SAMN05444162_1652 [Paenibacillaceae bacterium GAS479]